MSTISSSNKCDRELPEWSSLQVFRCFLTEFPNGVVSAERILSKECYDAWYVKRKSCAAKPEEAFRKILTAHVRGSDGRKPFHKQEEAVILKELRKRRVWPCFENTNIRIGINGFRAFGYHEAKLKLEKGRPDKQFPSRSECFSSYEIFVMFAGPDQYGVSRILSKECYDAWVTSRRHGSKLPEFSFRKALIAHLCGRDGRRPFPPQLEVLIVKELRKKEPWPCFIGNADPSVVNIGKKGFQQIPFHEGQRKSGGEEESSVNGDTLLLKHKDSFHRKRSSYDSKQHVSISSFVQTKSSCPIKKQKGPVSLPKIQIPAPNAPHTSSNYGLHIDPFAQTMQISDGGAFIRTTANMFHPLKANALNYGNEFVEDDYFYLDLMNCNPLDMDLYMSAAQDDDSFQGEAIFSEYCLHYHAPYSILNTFEDVTAEEVDLVLKLKSLTKDYFKQHFFREDDFPADVAGDVRLLRILRTCNGNLNLAVSEVEAILHFRKSWGVEKIREELIASNVSIEELQKTFSIGNKGGAHPFFTEAPNGDVVDIWVLRKQTDEDTKDMMTDLYCHIKLFEFKSIVLDRLSYLRRRIVGFRILLDCTAVSDGTQTLSNSGLMHEPQPSIEDWWGTLRTFSWYVRKLNELGNRWYGGYCSKLNVYGNGFLFSALSTTVSSSYLASMLKIIKTIQGRPVENIQSLRMLMGDQNNWPSFYGGNCYDPTGTGPAKRPLSQFLRRAPAAGNVH